MNSIEEQIFLWSQIKNLSKVYSCISLIRVPSRLQETWKLLSAYACAYQLFSRNRKAATIRLMMLSNRLRTRIWYLAMPRFIKWVELRCNNLLIRTEFYFIVITGRSRYRSCRIWGNSRKPSSWFETDSRQWLPCPSHLKFASPNWQHWKKLNLNV